MEKDAEGTAWGQRRHGGSERRSDSRHFSVTFETPRIRKDQGRTNEHREPVLEKEKTLAMLIPT